MHVAPVSQVTVGADGTVTADVESVWGVPPPVVNGVEVAVTFQPAPEPVASPTSKDWVVVAVWSRPFRVILNPAVLGELTNARLAPLTVAVADVAPAGSAPATRAPTTRRAPPTRRRLRLGFIASPLLPVRHYAPR